MKFTLTTLTLLVALVSAAWAGDEWKPKGDFGYHVDIKHPDGWKEGHGSEHGGWKGDSGRGWDSKYDTHDKRTPKGWEEKKGEEW